MKSKFKDGIEPVEGNSKARVQFSQDSLDTKIVKKSCLADGDYKIPTTRCTEISHKKL